METVVCAPVVGEGEKWKRVVRLMIMMDVDNVSVTCSMFTACSSTHDEYIHIRIHTRIHIHINIHRRLQIHIHIHIHVHM